MIPFVLTVSFYSCIVGGITGIFWALAVRASLLSGMAWGAGLETFLFVSYGLLATASGRIAYREGTFAIGSVMVPLNGLAVVLALVVWGIRAAILH